MTAPAESPEPWNARMHQGGKLSFRARLEQKDTDPGDRLVHGGRNPPALADLVPRGFASIEVEIGPGKGAFVLAATAARPDAFVLGIEAAPGYAAHAAAKLFESGRRNGLLLIDNGKLWLQDRVPEAALDAVHVYFPDPWPKRRHAGRRFFTDDVPAVLARALRDGGYLFVATDNPAYGGQIVRVMGSADQFAADHDERDARLQRGAGHAFSPTNFERKYIEQGRVIRRYAFRRRPRLGSQASPPA